MLEKGVSVEAGNGVIKSLEATPGLSATVRTLESLGEQFPDVIVDHYPDAMFTPRSRAYQVEDL